MSGVNRRCVGGAERMTYLGCKATILPFVEAPRISQNVNCAITVMADTDRSLAWVEFGQSPTRERNPPAESLSAPASQVFGSAQIKVMGMRCVHFDVNRAMGLTPILGGGDRN